MWSKRDRQDLLFTAHTEVNNNVCRIVRELMTDMTSYCRKRIKIDVFVTS